MPRRPCVGPRYSEPTGKRAVKGRDSEPPNASFGLSIQRWFAGKGAPPTPAPTTRRTSCVSALHAKGGARPIRFLAVVRRSYRDTGASSPRLSNCADLLRVRSSHTARTPIHFCVAARLRHSINWTVAGVRMRLRIVMMPTAGNSIGTRSGTVRANFSPSRCRATERATKAIARRCLMNATVTRNDADSIMSVGGFKRCL